VCAAPERGRANAEVIDLLASTLGLRKPQVRVVGGSASRDKLVEVEGLALAEAERMLDEARTER
jgi:uncharacterized protein YggU (UPF0235/DUF167 family)